MRQYPSTARLITGTQDYVVIAPKDTLFKVNYNFLEPIIIYPLIF